MKQTTREILILTCEHASNKLPAAFKSAVPAEVLKTHRAYDIGAIQVFRKLVKFAKPEFFSEGKFSRLFVDLNRTITNKSAFSDYLRNNAKAKVQATAYWTEYRTAIEKFVESALKPKTQAATIVHLGIHSFTLYAGIERQGPQHRHRNPLRPRTSARAGLRKCHQGRNPASAPRNEGTIQLSVQRHHRRAYHHTPQEIRPTLRGHRDRNKSEVF